MIVDFSFGRDYTDARPFGQAHDLFLAENGRELVILAKRIFLYTNPMKKG